MDSSYFMFLTLFVFLVGSEHAYLPKNHRTATTDTNSLFVAHAHACEFAPKASVSGAQCTYFEV